MTAKKLLVLYSWEHNNDANKWALAFCSELSRYELIEVSCDMLWSPHSNIKQEIYQKIQEADNILILVTRSYNEKIENKIGMVSYEETIYKEVINRSEEKNKILFLLKESNISLPNTWEAYNRIDISLFNANTFFGKSPEERQEKINEIVRFCFGIPEYEIPDIKDQKIPSANKVKSFAEWYSEDIFHQFQKDEKELPLVEQEQRILDFIKRNAFQSSFVDLYIRAGLSADLNLCGRMTPQMFIQYFLVKRNDREEEQYNSIINELFSSSVYNCLCLQSDGGSGKSIFIQTMSSRKTENNREYYHNIIFDLSSLTENNNTKEDLLFQRVRKEYTRMSRGDGSYYDVWRSKFKERITQLEFISFDDSRLFSIHDLQRNLQQALPHLLPDKLDDWYIGYTSRISQTKNANPNVLFTILMIIYLTILDSKPQLDKPERFILVFDNIETYDNGRRAQRISNFIEICYGYLKTIFFELGVPDNFFTKFTFVVVLRTSTLIPFSNLQSDMWAGERFVKKIKYFDFMEEALLKKLKFLQKIPNYRNTLLFKMLYTVVSVMLPTNSIDEYLQSGVLSDSSYRYFTSKRILPLFNNNYRQTMRNLYGSITNEERKPTIFSMLMELKGLEGSVYDYFVNGIRMALVRDIFNRLRTHNYFSEIGFSELSGTERHSMTRMVLGYLYWDEVRNIVKGSENTYTGVELNVIAKTFSYFCTHDKLVKILYGLSIYCKRNNKKEAALYEWGNLLVFNNLDVDLTEKEFGEVVKQYLTNGTVEIEIGDIVLNLKKVTIRLSDAGMCFTQYYIRSIEFLMSRSVTGANWPALFLMKEEDVIKASLDDIYAIMFNCINKLTNGCEHMCVFYGKEKKECVYRKIAKGSGLDILSCSLFIRYQECLDMVREAIDYIDRYRIVMYRKLKNDDLNVMILNQISKYYGLYNEIARAMKESANSEELTKFMSNWEYPNNFKLNDLIGEKIKHSKRVHRNRPIQAYYARNDENIDKAIKYVKEYPLDRLYEIMKNETGVEENAN